MTAGGMRPRPETAGVRLAGLAFGLLVALAPGATHATVADDLCSPLDDPCVVTGSATVTPGSTLAFGARTLQLAAGAALSWSGDVTMQAGACDFRAGSVLREASVTAGPHFLYLDCAGSSTFAGAVTTLGAGLLVSGNGPLSIPGSIKAQGDEVGVIAVDFANAPGDITVSGKIQVKSKVGTPPGEFRLVSNFGNITLTETAKIKLGGVTANPFTEFFFFEAGSGTLTVDGVVDARAKTGAYAFNFEANQDVVFGPRSKLVTKARTTGAEIAINSQIGSVTLQGKILAGAKAVDFGDGPRVRVCAGNDILVDQKASIDASDGAAGGSIVLGAFDIARVGTISTGAKLLAKSDGDIEVCGGTSGSISTSSTVVPEPAAVGSGVCLSPTSQVIFLLDCNAP